MREEGTAGNGQMRLGKLESSIRYKRWWTDRRPANQATFEV